MKSELEYEHVIKSLIDGNLDWIFGINDRENDLFCRLEYGDECIELVFHKNTDRQVVIDYFYNHLMNKGE